MVGGLAARLSKEGLVYPQEAGRTWVTHKRNCGLGGTESAQSDEYLRSQWKGDRLVHGMQGMALSVCGNVSTQGILPDHRLEEDHTCSRRFCKHRFSKDAEMIVLNIKNGTYSPHQK